MFNERFSLLLFGVLLCVQIASSDQTTQKRAPDSPSSFCNNWLCSAVLNLNTIGDLINELSDDGRSRNEDLKGTDDGSSRNEDLKGTDAYSVESVSDNLNDGGTEAQTRAEDSDDKDRLADLTHEQPTSNYPDNALDDGQNVPEDRDGLKDQKADDRADLDDRNGLDETLDDENGIDSLLFESVDFDPLSSLSLFDSVDFICHVLLQCFLDVRLSSMFVSCLSLFHFTSPCLFIAQLFRLPSSRGVCDRLVPYEFCRTHVCFSLNFSVTVMHRNSPVKQNDR